MKTITIINQKGGVGKSSTALSIGKGLARKGFSVLFVDLDGQGNLSYTMQANQNVTDAYDVLINPELINESIQQTLLGDVISSSNRLALTDTTIVDTGKEYRLKEGLERIKTKYDYCIIDTPPALGISTINALTASDVAIIPAQADIYSLQGISQLYATIQAVQRYTNQSLKILGIVLTRYNGRSIISKEISELIEQESSKIGTRLFNTKIRECTAIKESQAVRQDIYTYSIRCNASKDYLKLVDEICEVI